MDLRSQLLLRHKHLLSDVLLVGTPQDQLLAHLTNASSWCWHKGDYDYLTQHFAQRCYFGYLPPAFDFSQAVLFLPKSHELTQYLLYTLANIANCDEIFVVGEKRSGIATVVKFLHEIGNPIKIESAKHCQLWQVKCDKLLEQEAVNWVKEYELGEEYGNLHIISLPGVFAHGRLDNGTRLLLQNLSNLPGNNILDYGSGCGVISAFLTANYPQSNIFSLDVDAFACEASRMTLNANSFKSNIICASSLDDAPNNLTAIVSNPPFHYGVKTNHQIAKDLVACSSYKLIKNGEIRIVANEFLVFSKLLKDTFGNYQQLAHQDGYKVWSAIKN